MILLSKGTLCAFKRYTMILLSKLFLCLIVLSVLFDLFVVYYNSIFPLFYELFINARATTKGLWWWCTLTVLSVLKSTVFFIKFP